MTTMTTTMDSDTSNSDGVHLDKTIFNKTITLVAVNIPSKLCSTYLSTFAKYTLSLPKTKRIIHIDGTSDRRLVLLSDTLSSSLLSLTNNNVNSIHEHLPEDLKSYNTEQGGTVELYRYHPLLIIIIIIIVIIIIVLISVMIT
jgi:hypothetical protein